MKLVKVLAAAVLAFSAALVCAADGDPPAAIGRLNYVSGQVSFAPAQANEDWVAASLNRPITTGDRLWTDTGGRAEMHVGSLAVRMDALTSVDVLNLDDRALQLRLAQGSASVRVRRGTGGEPVEIATPGGAVVLTRPGAYRVNVDPQGSATSVAVRGGGQAEIFGANGSFVVRDGEQATIAGGRQDVALAPAPDDFDRWTVQRDRREDRVAATRYVPAEMTGYEDLDEYGSWRTVPEYGAVWQPTTVPAGWAPYRHGHWVWVSPWGWTWVDDAPWGFAPSHYGRWVWLGRSWAWAPGRIVARPVYAPALVAFVGGPHFSVSIEAGSGPAVGWVPLGWREPYRPWYRASHAHVRDVNIANVTNVTNINNINVRYVNRSAPSAVTVVSRENFVAARPVQRAALKVSPRTAAAAPVTVGAPVAAPGAASLAQARPGARPPAEIRNREVMAVNAPPAPGRLAARDGAEKGRRAGPTSENEPRVRVIARQDRVNPGGPGRETQTPNAQPESANLRERAPDKAGHADDRRRAAAPPADVSGRQTFDRAGRAQTVQPERRAAPAGAPEVQRGERQAPQHARPAEEERRAQRERQQEEAQRSDQQRQSAQRERERRAAEEQQAQRAEQSARARQQAGERVEEKAQREAQGRAQEQARQREQVQRAEREAQQRAQPQAEQRARVEAEHQSRQRAQEQARQREAQQRGEQQAQQRAQQQAEQRARVEAEHQSAQRAQEQAAHQHEAQQRAQQQAQQRGQQQAQQRAQQQARQQAERQAQQRGEEQAQRAEQQAQRERRSSEPHEKSGRERPRPDKSEKG